MSVTTGYQPERIDALNWHTRASIGDLSLIRSSDPAAASAMHAVMSMRRNLEDQWLPLIVAIKVSVAMVSWTASSLSRVAARLDEWLTFSEPSSVPSRFATMSDDDLLRELWAAGQSHTHGGVRNIDERIAAGEGFWSDDFSDLAEELAARVRHDDEFAARLAGEIDGHALAAVAIGHADFPVSFSAAVLPKLLQSDQWWSGVHDVAIENALSHVVASSPAAALDLLGNHAVLDGLARASIHIDTEIIRNFVRTGLYDAVEIDRERLRDGFDVLADLAGLAGGDFDDGFSDGLARGVADSMFGYFDALADGIGPGFENGKIVMYVDSVRIGEFGSRDDVTNLFGTVMRDSEAQATIGAMLGAYSDRVIADLGPEIGKQRGTNTIAIVGDFFRDALRDEQAELVVAAATATARRENIGKAIGFGTGLWMSSTGVGPILSKVVPKAITEASKLLPEVEAENISHVSFDSLTYFSLQQSIFRHAIDHPEDRDALEVADVSQEQWNEIEHRLDEIDATEDPGLRTDLGQDLETFVNNEVAELNTLWFEISGHGDVSNIKVD